MILRVLAAPFLVLSALSLAACDDTPRGEQGIDFNVEGGVIDDANVADVHGPCQETPDPGGSCAQLGGPGTLYTHLIMCVNGARPFLLDCETPDAAPDAGSQAYCCTTGLI